MDCKVGPTGTDRWLGGCLPAQGFRDEAPDPNIPRGILIIFSVTRLYPSRCNSCDPNIVCSLLSVSEYGEICGRA